MYLYAQDISLHIRNYYTYIFRTFSHLYKLPSFNAFVKLNLDFVLETAEFELLWKKFVPWESHFKGLRRKHNPSDMATTITSTIQTGWATLNITRRLEAAKGGERAPNCTQRHNLK